MQEQSWAARGVGLVGREVGSWKGLELTPLWGTTGARQLGSPPCSARGVSGGMEKDFLHLSASGQVFAVQLHRSTQRSSLGSYLGREMMGACPMQNRLPQTSCITNIDGYRAASWGCP